MSIKFKFHQSVVYFIGALMICACAKIVQPTGGPLDEQPPSLILENSTPNYQTNFYPEAIELEFDEFIEIKSPLKNIVISPPLTNYPKYTVRGKKLKIELPDEDLRENATYQINFGKAIVDFTAGNATENLKYVFSTGSEIDSLLISGKVVDAITQKPLSDVLVMMYDNLSDTAFSTVKPIYFSRTTKEGIFELSNLRADTFRMYCLIDDNLSYTYDLPTEQIAFGDSLIVLTDSISGLNFQLFDEREIPSIITKDQKKIGLLKLGFSEKPRGLEFTFSDTITHFSEFNEDTLKLWYQTTLDSFDLFLAWEETLDTITVNKMSRKKEMAKLYCENCKGDHKYYRKDTIEIAFNHPLKTVNIDSIQQVDSLDQIAISEIKIKGRTLQLIGSIPDSTIAILKLLPGFVKDYYNQGIDTIDFKLRWKSDDDLGNIKLTLENMNPETQYIYSLLDNNNNIVNTAVLNQDSILNFYEIDGGKYKLELIIDRNKNGYWDSGFLDDKILPEPKDVYTLEELRKGWDLETTIQLKN